MGVWNVFANPDYPDVQNQLRRLLCRARQDEQGCRDSALLASALGSFATPSLRDLGQSDPYFHDGSAKTLEQVFDHYLRASILAKGGRVRNASRELGALRLVEADREPMVAFLRSLNVDYR